MLNVKKIVELFNAGKLDMESAEWYRLRGYALICADGRLVDIVLEEGEGVLCGF